MAKLTVGDNTTLKDLQKFASEMGDTSKLRAKYDKSTKTYTLYTSNKGSGTGLKNKLFGTVDNRRALAKDAIDKILFNTPRVDALGGHGISSLNVAFSSLQAGLPATGDIRGGAFKDLVKEVGIAFSQATLPPGIDIDLNGSMRGAIDLTTVHGTNLGPAVPIHDAVTRGVEARLGGTMVNQGGATVHEHFGRDATRMNFFLGGVQTNTRPAASAQERQVAFDAVARDLRSFAGTDNAARVLSSVLHQDMFGQFMMTHVKADGGQIQLQPPDNTDIPTGATYVDSNGNSENIGKPTQYRDVEARVSTYPNGDFKLEVNWDYYFSRARLMQTGDRAEMMPHEPSRVAKLNTSFEMRISKADADRGDFSFQFVGTPTATFEGKID